MSKRHLLWVPSLYGDTTQRFFRSEYIRGIATVSSGQIFSTLLPMVSAPLLGRLYAPEEYALFASYGMLANVLTSVATLQYHQGVIATSSHRHADNLLRLCLALSCATAVFSAALGIWLYISGALLASMPGGRFWSLLLPLSVLSLSLSVTGAAWASRHLKYSLIAFIQLSSTVISVVASIIFALLGLSADGLMAALLISQLAAASMYGFVLMKNVDGLMSWKLQRLKLVARKYRHLPRDLVPGGFADSVALQLPIFALGIIGGDAFLGHYSRARQLLALPVQLLGESVGRVFMRRVSINGKVDGDSRAVFLATISGITLMGLPVALILIVFGPQLFAFYLGPKWAVAGQVARILAPVMLLQMYGSVVGATYLVSGRTAILLRLVFLRVGLTGLVLLAAMVFALSPWTFMIWWAVASVAAFGMALTFSVIAFGREGHGKAARKRG